MVKFEFNLPGGSLICFIIHLPEIVKPDRLSTMPNHFEQSFAHYEASKLPFKKLTLESTIMLECEMYGLDYICDTVNDNKKSLSYKQSRPDMIKNCLDSFTSMLSSDQSFHHYCF